MAWSVPCKNPPVLSLQGKSRLVYVCTYVYSIHTYVRTSIMRQYSYSPLNHVIVPMNMPCVGLVLEITILTRVLLLLLLLLLLRGSIKRCLVVVLYKRKMVWVSCPGTESHFVLLYTSVNLFFLPVPWHFHDRLIIAIRHICVLVNWYYYNPP